jgi:hypothetical protein
MFYVSTVTVKKTVFSVKSGGHKREKGKLFRGETAYRKERSPFCTALQKKAPCRFWQSAKYSYLNRAALVWDS